MKKIILIAGSLVAIICSVVAFSAFEAHVINVTAHIANALRVYPPNHKLSFGTVFPQEYQKDSIVITTSDDFCNDNCRVSTVDYKIVQKPKCWNNNPADPKYAPVNYWNDECPEGFVKMPLLCEYLSKTPEDPADQEPFNDTGVLAFHNISEIATGSINKDVDPFDEWIIDLAVPCFEGMCSQDWDEFVASHNPQANPNDYILPVELEGKDFGCDLWIEVTGFSEKPVCVPTIEICDGVDNDCDGTTDESDATDARSWYRDSDSDGYGDPVDYVMSCSVIEGYVENGADCNDSDSNIYPGAKEVCDGLDNDCDGEVDEDCQTDLFFSEYIEGSSNNKALEIFNPTDSTIDLTGYKVQIFHNGAATPSDEIPLPSGSTLWGGFTYVICHAAANPAILDECAYAPAGALDFNGDDMITLVNPSNEIVDVIGQIGSFPSGVGWGINPTNTLDNTLVRNCGITHGDTNWSDVFDPAVEWDGYPVDDF